MNKKSYKNNIFFYTCSKTLVFAALFLSIFLISGCTALKRVPLDPPPCDPELDLDPSAHNTVEGQLSSAARSIERSLNILASAQEAESPPILNTAPLVTPEGGMGGTVNIDWTGPIEPLLDRIAQMTDYRLKILGNEPAIPIIITITAKHTILAEIIQNASFQAAKRAHVLVFPGTRVIELRYMS